MLGLRKATSKPGRLKGNKSLKPLDQKIPEDLEKMRSLLKKYAPLEIFQKQSLSLDNGCWVAATSLPRKLKKGKCLGQVAQEDVFFSLSFPLAYILTKDHSHQKGKRERVFGDPFYVSLPHVEQWAAAEGFYRIEGSLVQHGLSFWKKGKYFSKAQLLIYINQIRLERKLQPLAIYEEEGC